MTRTTIAGPGTRASRRNPTLIAALGGSTTYDIGNADDATWPSDLSKLLGKDHAVENLGVPGYSSLENLIQSLFAFRDRRPACAIYYVGWNDLHTAHAKDLRNDYSDYQLPSQIGNLAVGRRPGFLENNMLLLRMILSVFATPERQAQGRMSGESDPRLSRIFSENMRLIADIDRHFGVKAIFVPQILNYSRFKDAGSSSSIPLVPDKDVKTVMQALNQDLAAVAEETGTLSLDKPLSVAWQNSDFVDQGHFSAAGAKRNRRDHRRRRRGQLPALAGRAITTGVELETIHGRYGCRRRRRNPPPPPPLPPPPLPPPPLLPPPAPLLGAPWLSPLLGESEVPPTSGAAFGSILADVIVGGGETSVVTLPSETEWDLQSGLTWTAWPGFSWTGWLPPQGATSTAPSSTPTEVVPSEVIARMNFVPRIVSEVVGVVSFTASLFLMSPVMKRKTPVPNLIAASPVPEAGS